MWQNPTRRLSGLARTAIDLNLSEMFLLFLTSSSRVNLLLLTYPHDACELFLLLPDNMQFGQAIGTACLTFAVKN